MNKINTETILEKMEQRLESLTSMIERDFTGNYDSNVVGRHKELKYWIGAIKRGEFDK